MLLVLIFKDALWRTHTYPKLQNIMSMESNNLFIQSEHLYLTFRCEVSRCNFKVDLLNVHLVCNHYFTTYVCLFIYQPLFKQLKSHWDHHIEIFKKDIQIFIHVTPSISLPPIAACSGKLLYCAVYDLQLF